MVKDYIFSSLNNPAPDLTIGAEGKGTPPKPATSALGSGDMLSLVRELLGFRQGDPGWMTTEERRAARKDNPIYADLTGIGSHRARNPRPGVVEDPGSFRGIKMSDYDAKKIEDKAASRGMSVEDFTKLQQEDPLTAALGPKPPAAPKTASTTMPVSGGQRIGDSGIVAQLGGGRSDFFDTQGNFKGSRLEGIDAQRVAASVPASPEQALSRATADTVVTDATGAIKGTARTESSSELRKALASGDISAIEAATKAARDARKPQDQVAKALGLPPASFISRLNASNAY